MKRTLLLCLTTVWTGIMSAHPLGVFSINRYARIELAGKSVRLVYIVDMAEIPSIQEFTRIDANGDGSIDPTERMLYIARKTSNFIENFALKIDSRQASLQRISGELSFPRGQGGLRTTRLVCRFETGIPDSGNEHEVHFEDRNFVDRGGWKEIVVRATGGDRIEQSTVPAKDLTDELRSYPPDMLFKGPNVTEASVRFVPGASPDARGIGTLAADIVQRTSDTFTELISTHDLSFPVILFSLLIAMGLGAGHALTPGHGKTIVAAYLVGSRGNASQALFLGLTVTATHTIGVFIMGLIALFASKYVLPEHLFPWLGLVSGILVAGIGVSLFFSRLHHAHEPGHTHGTHGHSHNAIRNDGTPVGWKSLFALGVSGGLLPCPSAIVVLLSAIALGRVGFGLLLIVAFSVGLASVLTLIGLLMVYGRGLFDRFEMSGPLVRWVPVASACVIAFAGVAICAQSIAQTILPLISYVQTLKTSNASLPITNTLNPSALSILGLGFILGLRHALDADHLVAVSTIVSERKGFLSSSIVGTLWGMGHTLSLFLVGLLVIALHVVIPEKAAQGMELAVALMLVALGTRVIVKLARGGTFHVHVHDHHLLDHIHTHPPQQEHSHHTRSFSYFLKEISAQMGKGKRSILIGIVHGMAGSAALMLIVLATIPSRLLALLYIAVFGVGSIGGMLIMSTLIGIPFVMTAHSSHRLNLLVRGIAGLTSVTFGLILTWQIGFVDRLFV